MRIHHLSDVHFGTSQYKPTNRSRIIPEQTARNAKAYEAHLAQLKPDALPDLIIISGDFATFAKEDEIDAAEDFVNKLVHICVRRGAANNLPRVMIVPGNHDVDWLKSTPSDRHARFGRFADSVYNNGLVLSSLYHQELDRKVCADFPASNTFVYLLNSTYYGGTADALLQGLYKAIQDKAANLVGVSENVWEEFGAEVRRDPGYVHGDEVAKMRTVMATVGPERFKIAVVHHNPNHVPSDDIDSYDTIVNSGTLKSALLECGFDLVLHGHRHIFHCSAESHSASLWPNRRCYFVSADSLGCKEHAPFLELNLSENPSLARPVRSVRIHEYSYSAGTGYSAHLRCDAALSNPLADDFAELVSRRSEPPDSSTKARWRNTISTVIPALQRLQSELTDWTDDSSWIRDFHNQLDFYKRIWATAIYDRPITGNPSYHKYLREQFDERLKRLHASQDKVLYFSPELFSALLRTSWTPSPVLWSEFEMKKSTDSNKLGLEIARVMVIDRINCDEQVLRNLDHDHALCAIPLLVIDREFVPPGLDIDFAVGLNDKGLPLKACAYDRAEGKVRERAALDAHKLLDLFEKLLTNTKLMTVDRYLGVGKMVGPEDIAIVMAEDYVATRKPSALVMSVLAKHLPGSGDTGLDLCCGTGNYTKPFGSRFRNLIGLDESDQMLRKARELWGDVARWVHADAKVTTLPDESCDAVWMISALHYFHGEQQALLFQEIFRILKPGGVFIADTEFLEQHPSLWIVDYFPSLKDRYRGRLHTRNQYSEWLKDAGFESSLFETYIYPATEADLFLRIGQNDPKRYLEERVRKAIPAFRDMNANERRIGLNRLRDEVATGEVERVRKAYIARAQVSGDIGFIVARKTARQMEVPEAVSTSRSATTSG